MGKDSKIDWTNVVWNPVTGCDKVSPGCERCYAEMTSRRLQGRAFPEYQNGFQITLHEHKVYMPLNLKKPKSIFVNSMGDMFHPDVPIGFLQKIFQVMGQAKQHRFQILTKYVDRMLEVAPQLVWSDNVWTGVSVENQDYIWRIDQLRKIASDNLFVAFEPLIGPIMEVNLDRIRWVLVGGESGKKARRMEPDWVRTIRDLCVMKAIPFFFVKWDKGQAKLFGRTLDGKTWEQFPA